MVQMNKYIAAYAGTFFVLVSLDMIWLSVIAKPLYQQGIGHLLADNPQVGVAMLFYLLFALGLLVFAVLPQHGGSGWVGTVILSALFGFFAYATYDLTNLATLRGWPLDLSLLDLGWGTVVSAVAGAGGKAALDWATTRPSP